MVSGDDLDFVPNVDKQMVFDLEDFNTSSEHTTLLRIMMETNLEISVPVSIGYNLSPIDPTVGIIYATVVLLGLYILIIFEVF